MSQYVYGACCSWHGNISETVNKGIPVCPKCFGPLFETTEEEWNDDVNEFSLTHPFYVDFILWIKTKHYPIGQIRTKAVEDFNKETGNKLILS